MRGRVVGSAGGAVAEVPSKSAGHEVRGQVGETERVAVGCGARREIYRASWCATWKRWTTSRTEAEAADASAADGITIYQHEDVGGSRATVHIRHNHLIITGLIGRVGRRIGAHVYPKPLPLVVQGWRALRGMEDGSRASRTQCIVGRRRDGHCWQRGCHHLKNGITRTAVGVSDFHLVAAHSEHWR